MAALVRYWGRQEPAQTVEELAGQAAEALWMEERFYAGLAQLLGGGK